MAKATPYCYKALNGEAYDTLATYMATSSLDSSFYPKLFSIVVTPDEEEGEALKKIGEFIDNSGLSFQIEPVIFDEQNPYDLLDLEVTPPSVLRDIVSATIREAAITAEKAQDFETRVDSCESELAKIRKDRDLYTKWWRDENARRIRLEETVKAFRTLINLVVD